MRLEEHGNVGGCAEVNTRGGGLLGDEEGAGGEGRDEERPQCGRPLYPFASPDERRPSAREMQATP